MVIFKYFHRFPAFLCVVALLCTCLVNAQESTPAPTATVSPADKLQNNAAAQNRPAKKRKKRPATNRQRNTRKRRANHQNAPIKQAGANTQVPSREEMLHLQPGRWKKINTRIQKTGMTPEQLEVAEQLEAIGYLDC